MSDSGGLDLKQHAAEIYSKFKKATFTVSPGAFITKPAFLEYFEHRLIPPLLCQIVYKTIPSKANDRLTLEEFTQWQGTKCKRRLIKQCVTEYFESLDSPPQKSRAMDDSKNLLPPQHQDEVKSYSYDFDALEDLLDGHEDFEHSSPGPPRVLYMRSINTDDEEDADGPNHPHSDRLDKNSGSNTWHLWIYGLIFWNVHFSRKLLYPFTRQFAEFYGVSVTTFSLVLAAFGIGATISVLLTAVPSLLHIPIHITMFLLIVVLSGIYVSAGFISEMVISEFMLIFVLRMGMGFISTTVSNEVCGLLSVLNLEPMANTLRTTDTESGIETDHENEDIQQRSLLRNGSESSSSRRVFWVETSRSLSTGGWVVVGVLLYRFNVDYVWYFGAICALVTALWSCCLPRSSVAKMLNAKKDTMNLNQQGDGGSDTQQTDTLWNQCHLYSFWMGHFFEFAGYSAWNATFGTYIQDTYNLNAEQLGFQMGFIVGAELLALALASYSPMNWTKVVQTLMSAEAATAVIGVFALLLWFINLPLVLTWSLLFVYALWMEHVHLNCILSLMEMTPRGVENQSALMAQSVVFIAEIAGVIGGPFFANRYGFPAMIAAVFCVQWMAVILWNVARNVFNAKQKAKRQPNTEMVAATEVVQLIDV